MVMDPVVHFLTVFVEMQRRSGWVSSKRCQNLVCPVFLNQADVQQIVSGGAENDQKNDSLGRERRMENLAVERKGGQVLLRASGCRPGRAFDRSRCESA